MGSHSATWENKYRSPKKEKQNKTPLSGIGPWSKEKKKKKKRNGHRERTVRKVRGETEGCLWFHRGGKCFQ